MLAHAQVGGRIVRVGRQRGWLARKFSVLRAASFQPTCWRASDLLSSAFLALAPAAAAGTANFDAASKCLCAAQRSAIAARPSARSP